MTSSSYGRDSRLHNRCQFSMVREHGRSFVGSHCIVNVLNPSPDGASRAGFSVSKRYSRLAVDRNRARRLFREVYHAVYERVLGCWVIFIPRRRMMTADCGEVLRDVQASLGHLVGGERCQ